MQPLTWRSPSRTTLAITAILVLAAVLRLHAINFGIPALNDPDELLFEMGATRMLTGPTLNPGWFGHPATITMYVLALVNAATFAVGWLLGYFPDVASFMHAIYGNPGIVMVPGRIAMAAFGVMSVWQSWRIACDLAGIVAGLVAAMLLACNTIFVHYAQIIRSDMVGTVFVLMTIMAALRVARNGELRDYRLAALGTALAVASKWPFGTVAVAVLGAGVTRFLQDPDQRRSQRRRLTMYVLLVPVLLVMISPYLVLDYQTVLRNLSGEAQVKHLGATSEGVFANMWWYLRGPLYTALGLPGLILATVGIGMLSRQRQTGWVILPGLLLYGTLICFHGLRWERWVVPMLPLLAIAAGIAAAAIVRLARTRWPGTPAARITAAMAVAIPLQLTIAAWNDATSRTNDTRQIASHWARLHIAPGSRVMIENFAFDLIDAPWTILFPMGDAGCVDAKAIVRGQTDYKVIEQARGSRANVDYGTVAGTRRNSCRADFAILMDMDRYRAEQDRFPAEYAAYTSLLQDMEVRAIIRPEEGMRAGPVMTILQRKLDAN